MFERYQLSQTPSSPPSDTTSSGGAGTLVVQVTSAKGAIPVEHAEVQILQNDGTFISALYTDQSGYTAPTRLSAPKASLSQTSDGAAAPYAMYQIRVSASGYTSHSHRDIAVFDGISSIQPVSLRPVAEFA